MVTLIRIFEDEYKTELVEFTSEKNGFVDYGYVDKESLLDCYTRKDYGAFFYVAEQLKVGPEDVEDALIRWYHLKSR